MDENTRFRIVRLLGKAVERVASDAGIDVDDTFIRELELFAGRRVLEDAHFHQFLESLNTRALNGLYRFFGHTPTGFSEVVAVRRADLRRVQGLGSGTLRNLEDALAKHGLELEMLVGEYEEVARTWVS